MPKWINQCVYDLSTDVSFNLRHVHRMEGMLTLGTCIYDMVRIANARMSGLRSFESYTDGLDKCTGSVTQI